mmetsp:Transcript_41707/g.69421  ORF Transcript_41707/g.69421 Transcript_41707/m.69421 type:complete len:101 (+) Transcript_41707:2040-2342(+)
MLCPLHLSDLQAELMVAHLAKAALQKTAKALKKVLAALMVVATQLWLRVTRQVKRLREMAMLAAEAAWMAMLAAKAAWITGQVEKQGEQLVDSSQGFQEG